MALNSTQLHPEITQIVPPGVDYTSDRVGSSVLVQRRTVKYFPQAPGPYTFNGTNVIEFNLSSATDELLDGRSMTLNFQLGTFSEVAPNPSRIYMASDGLSQVAIGVVDPPRLADGGMSWVRSVLVSAAGVPIEYVENYNLICNLMVYYTATRDWIETFGPTCGYIVDFAAAHALALSTSNGTSMQNPDVSGNAAGNGPGPSSSFMYAWAAKQYVGAIANVMTPMAPEKGMYLSTPFLLLGICRTLRLLPLKYFRNLQIRITLADPVQCIVAPPKYESVTIAQSAALANRVRRAKIDIESGTGAGDGVDDTAAAAATGFPNLGVPPVSSATALLGYGAQQVGYQINRAYLTCDLVVPHPLFSSALAAAVENSALGLAFKLDGFETINWSQPTPTDTTTVVTNLSKSKVRALWAVQRWQQDINVPHRRTLEQFSYNGVSSYRWQIGPRYFPEYIPGRDRLAGNRTLGDRALVVQTSSAGWDRVDHPTPIAPFSTSINEFWVELQKSIAQYGDVFFTGGLTTPFNYAGPTPYIDEVYASTIYSPNAAYAMNTPLKANPSVVDYTTVQTGTDANANFCKFTTMTKRMKPGRFAIGQDLEVINGLMTGADFKSNNPTIMLTLQYDNAGGWAPPVSGQDWNLIYHYDYMLLIKRGAIQVVN